MNKTTTSLTLILALAASLTAKAESTGYLELSSVMRVHNYDLDITQGGTRYHIDEQSRSGWKLEGGWSFAPNWTLLADYSKHDTDNAVGIILTPLTLVQAPVFYVSQRASIGIQKQWPLTESVWLDTTIRYQRTEQGVGDFFIQSEGFTFGLDKVESDHGMAAEVAIRKLSGNWEFEVLAGYDPHAGFKLGASNIDVESSGYGGASATYHFGDHFKLGVEATSGKVRDVELTLGVLF